MLFKFLLSRENELKLPATTAANLVKAFLVKPQISHLTAIQTKFHTSRHSNYVDGGGGGGGGGKGSITHAAMAARTQFS